MPPVELVGGEKIIKPLEAKSARECEKTPAIPLKAIVRRRTSLLNPIIMMNGNAIEFLRK